MNAGCSVPKSAELEYDRAPASEQVSCCIITGYVDSVTHTCWDPHGCCVIVSDCMVV